MPARNCLRGVLAVGVVIVACQFWSALGYGTPVVYYVALGDSLAAGIGASTAANGYVQRIDEYESANIPGLELQSFACPGASTASMLNGPNCGSAISQVANAEAFLQSHSGQVAFVTIDIGANDVDGCVHGTSIDASCFAGGLQAIETNLPVILSSLQTAAPGVRVVAMNYYDPYLAAWLLGSSGQDLARQSLTDLDQLNSTITNIDSSHGIPTADVASAFSSSDFSPTDAYAGQTLPRNVADICLWTHMCTNLDIHANDIGHAVLAAAFESILNGWFAPTTTTTAPTTHTTVSSAAPSLPNEAPTQTETTQSAALPPTGLGIHIWAALATAIAMVLVGSALVRLSGSRPVLRAGIPVARSAVRDPESPPPRATR
jgi:lysophospholipase L1-like esterase